MRPLVPTILVFIILLIAFDYFANDGDLLRHASRWPPAPCVMLLRKSEN
jgi:hypothetical protein